MPKYDVEAVLIEIGIPNDLYFSRRPQRPCKSTQALIDDLVRETQRFGDNPPVVVLNGQRFSIGRVETCGGRDHILLEAVPERQ